MLVVLGAVHEQRDRGDGGGVEAFCGRVGKRGVDHVECVDMEEPRGPQHVRDGHGASPPLLGLGQEPVGADVEKQDEEDYDEKRYYGGEHDVAVIGEDALDELGHCVSVKDFVEEKIYVQMESSFFPFSIAWRKRPFT